MTQPHSFARAFVQRLQQSQSATGINRAELPTYDYGDEKDIDALVTQSSPEALYLGTGASIYTSALLPAMLSAKHEIILVTCFWAKSKTLTALSTCLGQLAKQRREAIEGGANVPQLRLQICLSSQGLLQKLLHTTSRDGYVYSPDKCTSTLGLPTEKTLQAAKIEMTVKSLFFLPFSVMHPKFVIIDRNRAFLPSCNVSWEAWLEGCVQVTGPVVRSLLVFYERTWEHDLIKIKDRAAGSFEPLTTANQGAIISPASLLVPVQNSQTVPTVLLPSSHRMNPDFRPFPWQAAAAAPPTPLNTGLLQLFDTARRHIYIQTPNVTSRPVIDALLETLKRGCNVEIVTSKNMMLLEQLVTAGTTTSWCIKKLVKRYQAMRTSKRDGSRGSEGRAFLDGDVGRLRISYFHSLRAAHRSDLEAGQDVDVSEEPVHSHFKCTIVDGQFTVLGSGNMDRASWYTSQELGILFDDQDFAAKAKSAVERVLEGRLDLIFDSQSAT